MKGGTPIVADNGVDWEKIPMNLLTPEIFAANGLNSLGKKLLAIPGTNTKVNYKLIHINYWYNADGWKC